MMYTNAQYVRDPMSGEVTSIRCDINGALNYVPIDGSNTDYQNIMALVAAGDLTIAPAS